MPGAGGVLVVGADGLIGAAVAARLEAERLRAALVLQIHDELLLEAPVEELPTVERLLVEAMRGAMSLDVPLEVSVSSGGDWAECG